MKKLFLTSIASKTLEEFTKILTDSPNKFTVAFISTAADPYKNKQFVEDDRKKLIELGFNVIDIDIKGKAEKQISKELKNVDIIFIAGGNTFYLLEKVRESGFDKLVKVLVQKGVIYVGSSAGATLAGPNIEPIKVLDDPSKAPNLKSFKGLGLINFVVLPHFDNKKYKTKYQKVMNEYKKKFKLVPITDSEVIVADENKYRKLGVSTSIKLTYKKIIKIKPTAPFNFDPTFHKPGHFPSSDNFWQPSIRWQTWVWKGKKLGLKFENKGTIENPLIALSIFSKKSLSDKFINSLVKEVRCRYNLELDLTGFYTKFKNDKVLGPIIKKWRGMRPGHPSSLYEYLIIGIVLQNATVRRSVQMFQALLENYGTLLEFDGKRLWCFWEPSQLKNVKEKDLRALKVGYRAKSILKIDEKFRDGLIDEMELRKKDRETQMKELLKLYGVGPATVWYLLFDVFHHWDFFNHISPWEQKIYSKLFFNRSPNNPVPVKKLLKHFEKYEQYKQLAVHYIWEDLWWKRKHEHIPWLEKEIRL